MIPQAAIELVKASEGCRLQAYRDCGRGIVTIGYGSTGRNIIEGMVITQEEAEALLTMDLQKSASSVLRLTKVHLNDNQFAALIDFVFNEGAGRFQASTVRIRLNRHEYKGAAEMLLKYVYAGGRVLPGLVARRSREYSLFMSK